ncbi:MAG: hypothetical protein V7707_02890 [Motiliproteus sp.]
MIKLVPSEGLCNRMRVIESAIFLSELFDVELKIYWAPDKGMNHKFIDLFEPIMSSGVSLECVDKAPSLFKKGSINNLYIPSLRRMIKGYDFLDGKNSLSTYDFSKLTKNGKVAIKTCHRLYDSAHNYNCFTPIEEVRERIEVRSQAFNQHTIGVHIRRTDHKNAIRFSPNQLFFEAMESELNKNSETNFYLASDCEKTKSDFKSKFGDALSYAVEIPTRDTLEGIQDAMVELYCLARTKKVYASYWSSFSVTAAEIGGVEKITLSIRE